MRISKSTDEVRPHGPSQPKREKLEKQNQKKPKEHFRFLSYPLLRNMGRRLRGAALRAKKRSTLAAQEIVETAAKETETQQVTSKKDEELFVLDTTAVLPSKKQEERKEKKKRKYTASAKEEAQINKLIGTHSAEKLVELAKTNTSKRAKIKKAVNPTFDLWGDEGDGQSPNKKRSSQSETKPGIGPSLAGTKPDHSQTSTARALPAPKSKKVSVDIAESGQSYNPDKVQHKKVIENAFNVERKRHVAEEIKNAPISKGMSDETKAYLLGDSDSDESDLEDESDTAPSEKRPMEKKKEKLTRAQRNRQKRIREEMKQIAEQKREKKFQKSVGEAKTISKQLRKLEAKQRERNEKLRKLKEDSERTKGKDVYQQMANEIPIDAPTYPVALTSELKSGSLRTIKPKGSLVTDRMASFQDRDMAAKKQTKRKRRVQGKRRKLKLKVRGKGYAEGGILG